MMVIQAFLALHGALLRSLYTYHAPYAEMARRTGASVGFVKLALTALDLPVPRRRGSRDPATGMEDHLRLLYSCWAPYRVMARLTGDSIPELKHRLRCMGLAVPRRRPAGALSTGVNRDTLLRHIGATASLDDLAACTGQSRERVVSDLERLGIRARRPSLQRRSGILSGLDAGFTPEAIARACGCSIDEVLLLRRQTGRLRRPVVMRPGTEVPPSELVVAELRRMGDAVSRCGSLFRIGDSEYSATALHQRLMLRRSAQHIPSFRQAASSTAHAA